MRENERKCKREGIAERFPPRNFIHQQKGLPLVQDLFGAYIMLNYKQKYKNIINTHLYMKGKMVKMQKVGQP